MQPIASNGASYTGMDYATAVANKAKDFTKQQGNAALALINSVDATAKASGANLAADRGYGTLLDVSA